MDGAWRTALWRQFGAAIEMLDNAIAACPDRLWTERLWPDPPPPYFPARFGEFWYVGYHALVWLDQYLSGLPEEEFAPPAPFVQGEIDSVGAAPERPYTKEELRTYLSDIRRRCQATLTALTEERARQTVWYPWMREGEAVSYLELQLYNLRHVAEHAAQLNLYLGQRAVPDVPGMITRARD